MSDSVEKQISRAVERWASDVREVALSPSRKQQETKDRVVISLRR